MDLRGHSRFKLKINTLPGQGVKVVGSHPSLGMWNPTLGVELTTDPNTYPSWSTTILLLPLNQTIEYKYLVYTTQTTTWESLPNRKLIITQNWAVIEDIFDGFISKIIYTPSLFAENDEIFNENVEFTDGDTIAIISYQLPITVTYSSAGDWEFELTKGVWQSQLYSLMRSSGKRFIWLGLPGIFPDSEEEKERLVLTMKKQFNCIPIFLSPQDHEMHQRFCSMILYKILHNIIDAKLGDIPDSEELWCAYKRVNIIFADQILLHHVRHMIWIHGSQLLLLPSFISRKSRDILNIGFFLHHPFPSSEIYRVFPHREAILHALCCCDLIGFHLFEYARNFFSCCKRVLNIDIELTKGGYLGLNYYGRHIMVKSEHIGIQEEMIGAACQTPGFVETYSELVERYRGVKVLLSIDSPIELAGMPLKLKAFRLARKFFKEPVLFLQILVSHTASEETVRVTQQIYALQQEINEAEGGNVIEIIEKELTNEERYAYISVSSALVISSIKDGLCLLPFEYLVIKQNRPCGIILSEFTGVSTALNSPIKINPFSVILT